MTPSPHTSIEAGTLAVIDIIVSIETPTMRLLRENARRAYMLNEQSANDPQDEEQSR